MAFNLDSYKSDTQYIDINLDSAVFSVPVATQPDEVQFVDNLGANTGIYSYGFAVGEKISGAFEIHHNYKEGENLIFHIHFQGITAPTGTDNIKWQLTYTYGVEDATLAPVTTIVKEFPYSTQYEFQRCDFDSINGSGIVIGDQFLFTLERIAASVDEYSGDAIVATIGIHIPVNSFGSRGIITK